MPIQAQSYLNAGKEYVVELDLAKFFDVVNHDKLMSLVSKKIDDKPTMKLLGKYLRSEIMTGRRYQPTAFRYTAGQSAKSFAI